MDSRFATRRFDGTTHQYFTVEQVTVDSQNVDTATDPTHHIVIVDASGSMYRDIASARSLIQKLWTLGEFKDSNQHVSLISYASQGDCVVHFDHVLISDVMASDSPYLRSLAELRTRGLTCMSQALEVAKGLVRPGELTAISMHSDGYANDRSPSEERRTIDRIIADYAGLDNVYVNTIAHRTWCDYTMLNSIANALSGKCIRAGNIRDVYDALHDTTSLLAGQRSPAITQQLGTADFQVFVSKSDRKVNGTTGDLTVRGLSKDGDKTIYRYRQVSEAEYNASSLPVCGEGADITPVYAFCQAQIAEGNLNTAKYALITTRNVTMVDEFSRALTNEEISEFAQATGGCIFDGTDGQATSTEYGLDTSQTSVLDILRVLDGWSSAITVNLPDLKRGYSRRSVSRIAGTRDKDTGEVEVPWVDTRFTDDGEWAPITGVDINRTTATANIKVRRPIELVERETGTAIRSVSGISLNSLADFRNYTLVGDGSLNVSSLTLRISDKRAFRELLNIGAVTGTFDPSASYSVDFASRPLVSYSATFSDIDGVFNVLAGYRVLGSILKALTSTTSVSYTDEQLAELKRHHLTPALYVSMPTTNPYADKDEALKQGVIDTRLSYKVEIGSSDIISLSKLKSANAYLQRRVVVTANGQVCDGSKKTGAPKSTWDLWWAPDFSPAIKKLSARTKLDAVDALMWPIFEDFLGLNANGAVEDILQTAGLDSALKARFVEAMSRTTQSKDEAVEVFSEVLTALQEAEAEVYESKVCPVAFYVGATGLMPDEFDTTALTADDVKAKYPNIKVGKSESEGTFFPVGDSLISVYVKPEYFSTGVTATA